MTTELDRGGAGATAEPDLPSSAPVAVVTGASGGVGRAVAKELAQTGFDVALVARGSAGLDGARRDVEAHGRRALILQADVADWDAVDHAASRIEDELGPIGVWINNAMTTVFGWSWDIGIEEYRRATEVTYLGQVHGTLAALARMRLRDRGRVVNVGSSLSYTGIPLQAPYCAAKFAARGFFESVRAELLYTESQVTISMVHLPAVNTPQFDWCEARLAREPQPVPPIYQPEVAARFIVDAALDGRRSKVVGLWNKGIVAATKIVPSVVSHFAAMSAVSGQQTSEAVAVDRPSNLWKPADDERDFGPRGRFSSRAHGVLTRQFLRSLPQTGRTLAEAAGEAARFKWRRRQRAALVPADAPVSAARDERV